MIDVAHSIYSRKISFLRFFFFSREEKRMHDHVETADGEAKFWMEPVIALADSINLSTKELSKIQILIEENKHEIVKSWKKHFQC